MGRFLAVALFALSVTAGAPGCYRSHERGGSRDHDAAVIADDATVIMGPARALEVAGRRLVDEGSYESYHPDLGWDGERVSVLIDTRWEEGVHEHRLLRMTRFAPDLSSASPLVELGAGALPTGAWDPARGFAMCRSIADPGPAQLWLHDREGRLLSDAIAPDGSGLCYGVVRAPGRWTMLHARHTAPDRVILRVSTIDDGAALVWTRDLDAVAITGSSIVADGDDFLVAAVLASGTGIVLYRIDRGGSLLARTVFELSPGVVDTAIAVHDDGTIGLLVRDGQPDRCTLRLVRLSHDFETLGETPLVVEPRTVGPWVDVVATPDGWAATWVELDREPPLDFVGRALLATLDRSGAPIEPRRILADEANLRSALLYASGALYAAVVRHTRRGGRVEVIRLAPAGPGDRCAPLDAASSRDDCEAPSGHAWNGATCAPICACVGSDCDRISPYASDCVLDHTGC